MKHKVYIKPPLGLCPKDTWIQIRVGEILNAIERYNDVEKPIPREWLIELREHLDNDTRQMRFKS